MGGAGLTFNVGDDVVGASGVSRETSREPLELFWLELRGVQRDLMKLATAGVVRSCIGIGITTERFGC
jgi:hypothetical protein